MAKGTPVSAQNWLALACPLCRSPLRIKEAYAHLRGRCPECGGRIEAPRPGPSAPPRVFSDADESQGLVPLEEEWPEPAQPLEEDERTTYGVTATPSAWPEETAPPAAAPPVAGYDLAGGHFDTPAPASPPPSADAYLVAPVDSTPPPPVTPIPYQLSLAEREPVRAPPPPRHPLLQGLFLFPWRLENVKTWLYQGVGLTVICWLASAVYMLFLLILQGNKVGAMLPLPLTAALFFALWVGSFCASSFLAAVQETAAGNDVVRWPDESVMDRFFKLFFLLWLAACSFIPLGLLVVLRRDLALGWLGEALLLFALFAFPVFLLSSLSAQAPWMLLDRKLLRRLLRTPSALWLLFVFPLVLLPPCLYVLYVAVVKIEIFVAPVAGLAWSSFLLVYGRLLGRAGWLMTLGSVTGRKSGIKAVRRRSASESEHE